MEKLFRREEYDRALTNEKTYCAEFNTHVLPILLALGVRDDASILRWARNMNFGRLFTEIVDAEVRGGAHRILAEIDTNRVMMTAAPNPAHFQLTLPCDYEPTGVDIPTAARFLMRSSTWFPRSLAVVGSRVVVDESDLSSLFTKTVTGTREYMTRTIDEFISKINKYADGFTPNLATCFRMAGNKWTFNGDVEFIDLPVEE